MAERFLKREFGAALAKDEIYVGYLESVVYQIKSKKGPSSN